jgi:RNA ligase (TIGR02306 family)
MLFRPTLKLDGTSCTYYVVNASRFIVKSDEPIEQYFGHCSRNLDKKDPGEVSEETPWKLAYQYGIKKALINFQTDTGRSIALQGELMGVRIQGNREKLQTPEFFLFKIWDIDKQRYFSYSEKTEFLKETGLTRIKHVPTYEPIKLFSVFNTLNEILEFAEGPSLNHPIREGLVFESVDELEQGGIISFKAISNKFLLKEKD